MCVHTRQRTKNGGGGGGKEKREGEQREKPYVKMGTIRANNIEVILPDAGRSPI